MLIDDVTGSVMVVNGSEVEIERGIETLLDLNVTLTERIAVEGDIHTVLN